MTSSVPITIQAEARGQERPKYGVAVKLKKSNGAAPFIESIQLNQQQNRDSKSRSTISIDLIFIIESLISNRRDFHVKDHVTLK